jgi:hypothetical protein
VAEGIGSARHCCGRPLLLLVITASCILLTPTPAFTGGRSVVDQLLVAFNEAPRAFSWPLMSSTPASIWRDPRTRYLSGHEGFRRRRGVVPNLYLRAAWLNEHGSVIAVLVKAPLIGFHAAVSGRRVSAFNQPETPQPFGC